MRRALAIDENSYGPEHPDVAGDLNNLAQLLQATNRLKEAEPLMRRVLRILFIFQKNTGYSNLHVEVSVNNYTRLMRSMGQDPEQIDLTLEGIYPGCTNLLDASKKSGS